MNDTTDTPKIVSYLDFYLEIDDGKRQRSNVYLKLRYKSKVQKHGLYLYPLNRFTYLEIGKPI